MSDGLGNFYVVMKRTCSQKTGETVLQSQIERLKAAALRGRGKRYECVSNEGTVKKVASGYIFTVKLNFTKVTGHKTDEVLYKDKEDIVERLMKSGSGTIFNKYPWKVHNHTDPEGILEPFGSGSVTTEDIGDQQTIGQYEIVTKPEEIIIPELLLKGSDVEVEEHDAFKGIYGRSAQIRTATAVLSAAFSTKMQRRHNILFWGYPGCGKSHLMKGIRNLLGPNAILELDSTSTTKAGIEKIFLSGLETGVPPVVFMEEIEKTDESALRVWLSALDDRREIRKVNFRQATVRKIDILCIATANDKIAFDKLFRSGNQSGRGALSSRFTKQIYVPQPDRAIMQRILERDIKEFGGKLEWIEPCLDLAETLNTKDPREVLGMLVGGDRLIDKSYQEDVLKIHEQEQADYGTDSE